MLKELLSILKDNGIELSDDAVVTATAEDNYAAELNGAELIEDGKVYVAMRQDGERKTLGNVYFPRVL